MGEVFRAAQRLAGNVDATLLQIGAVRARAVERISGRVQDNVRNAPSRLQLGQSSSVLSEKPPSAGGLPGLNHRRSG